MPIDFESENLYMIKNLLCISLILLIGTPLTAEELSDDLLQCATISDSLERLTCFDQLTSTLEPAELSVDAAFVEFQDLVRSEFNPSIGIREVYREGCTLYDLVGTVGRPVSQVSGNRTVIKIPDRRPLYGEIKLWALRVPLDLVEVDKIRYDSKFIHFSLERGHELTFGKAEIYFSFYGSSEEWVESASEIQASGMKDFVKERPASQLQKMSTDQIEFWAEVSNGLMPFSRADNVNSLDFEIIEKRSTGWTFHDLWPEDRSQINDAFVDLVKACQA